MIRTSTNRDIQRVTFIESLHASFKKQAEKAIDEQEKFSKIASSYLRDGLTESECIELLVIDGLSREASESYVSMVINNEEKEIDGLHEYSFQFEDSYGRVWSSFDINQTVKASNDDDAWTKAEELIDMKEGIEAQKIISINRLDENDEIME